MPKITNTKLSLTHHREDRRVESRDRQKIIVTYSNKHTGASFLDPNTGRTEITVIDYGFSGTKSEKAHQVGLAMAKKVVSAGYRKIVFDRRRHRYHGRIKAIAEGLREGGLEF